MTGLTKVDFSIITWRKLFFIFRAMISKTPCTWRDYPTAFRFRLRLSLFAFAFRISLFLYIAEYDIIRPDVRVLYA